MNDTLQAVRMVNIALWNLQDSIRLIDDPHQQVMMEIIIAAVFSQRENLLAAAQVIELPKQVPMGDAA
jgi:hypothetical protein